MRLFCFHHAGGGASMFSTWAAWFLNDTEVCPVQLPARENRLKDPPISELSNLLEQLAPQILPYLDMPFAFFGHSLGALVSFELSRFLRRQYSLTPNHLIVSGYVAPQRRSAPTVPVHNLPTSELLSKLSSIGGTAKAVLSNKELMQLLIPAIRADFTIHETYTYQRGEVFDFPISAYGGLADHGVSRHDLEAWSVQTDSAFKLRMFPGGHFYINSQRTLLLEALTQDIARCAE